MIRVGELFAGIGGIGLGLEMAGGFEVAWQVERDPYAQKVLAKNWPGTPLHDDVKTFPPDNSNKWQVDMITGGFPCHDISVAGKGAGLNGDRSGLFYEIIRIAGVLQPRFLLLENVPALLTRGLPEVLGALAQSGYDAQWRVLSAAEMGAPHLRKRIFIFCTLADTDKQNVVQHSRPSGHYKQGRRGMATRTETVQQKNRETASERPAGCREAVADTDGKRKEWAKSQDGKRGRFGMVSEAAAYTDNTGCSKQRRPLTDGTQHAATECSGWLSAEPDVGRVAHGISSRMDRLRCLGNAVVPQCVAWLAHNWILPAIKSR